MKTLLRATLSLGLLTLALHPLAAQPTPPPPPVSSIGSGFDYSSGDYGFSEDTEVFSVPLDLAYEDGPAAWRVSFSYLTIKGPATVVGGGGAARPTSNTESGFGDIYLSGTYRFGETLGKWELDGTVRVKAPTASESRGLGTGEWDVYGQLDLHRTFGKVTPFASLGWREFGTSAAYPLHSGIYTSAGAHFRPSASTVITGAFNWGERILDGEDDTTDALIAVTHDVNPNWRILVYALTGFTDASPDIAVGGRLTYRY